MRRRDIIAGLLVAAAFGRAQAQSTARKIPRIGYLGTNIGPASLPPIEAFREGLRQLGYTEGQNIIVEYRWARGPLPARRYFSAKWPPQSWKIQTAPSCSYRV